MFAVRTFANSFGVLALACNSSEWVPSGLDGAADSADAPDARRADAGASPCSRNGLRGSCDLVSQDCPDGGECVARGYADGGIFATCEAPGEGAIQEGDTCTSSPTNNPCVAGLECVNNRCSKHCCGGDSTVCGTSPEGYPGLCDLTITNAQGASLYMLCEYNAPCEPFDLVVCPTGSECLVRDRAGTATCQNVYNPPGKDENAPCARINECKDGLVCAGTCQWLCYHAAASSPPFDAGGLDLTMPGRGGCPTGETCQGTPAGLPDWAGLCQ